MCNYNVKVIKPIVRLSISCYPQVAKLYTNNASNICINFNIDRHVLLLPTYHIKSNQIKNIILLASKFTNFKKTTIFLDSMDSNNKNTLVSLYCIFSFLCLRYTFLLSIPINYPRFDPIFPSLFIHPPNSPPSHRICCYTLRMRV